MKEVYILDGLRSPIGIAGKQFKKLRPEKLGALVINQLLARNEKFELDQVLLGNAVGTGGNLARLSCLYSDLSPEVPALTLDMQCASSAASIRLGASLIASNQAHYLLVGGIESSSLQPLRRYADLDEREGDYMVAQFSPDNLEAEVMLFGAEKSAQVLGASAQDLARLAARSHQLAQETKEAGLLDNHIFPMEGMKDQSIRPSLTEKKILRLPGLLGPSSLTNAGNACLTHDGAAFLILTDQATDIRILASLDLGGDPDLSPLMNLDLSQKLLQQVGLGMEDMDVIEWNQAFAVIDYLFEQHFPHLIDRYNAWGGALAYGHPYAASGAMICLHAIARLRAQNGRYALVSIAGAGGVGSALLLERISQ